MPKTIEVRNDVFVTGSVACDDKVLREYYRDNVENLIKVFDECKKIFKLENTKMLINNIRKKSTSGQFVHQLDEIRIDIRSYNFDDIIKTIIHEMTHAKQSFDKKLKVKGSKMVWNNEEFSNPKNHDEYLNLPWEIEARKNSEKYFDKVKKTISK